MIYVRPTFITPPSIFWPGQFFRQMLWWNNASLFYDFSRYVLDFIPYQILEKNLNLLEEYIERQDKERALKILHRMVPQWQRSSKSESF